MLWRWERRTLWHARAQAGRRSGTAALRLTGAGEGAGDIDCRQAQQVVHREGGGTVNQACAGREMKQRVG